jgi:urease accessory protein
MKIDAGRSRPRRACSARPRPRGTALLILTLLPFAAAAHDGHAATGFVAGLMHPLTGVDHLLALLVVGWWSALRPARQAFALPAVFTLAMLVGALLARAGLELPGSEATIAASLLGLGLLLWRRSAMPLRPAAMLVALFALAHGSAHGRELAPSASDTWLLGMLCASGSLQLAGFMSGRALRERARWATPLSGALTASAGVVCALALLAA